MSKDSIEKVLVWKCLLTGNDEEKVSKLKVQTGVTPDSFQLRCKSMEMKLIEEKNNNSIFFQSYESKPYQRLTSSSPLNVYMKICLIRYWDSLKATEELQ